MKKYPPLPKIYILKQHFQLPEITDITQAINAEISTLNLKKKIRTGETVAITAGSRGIKNIDLIIKSVVNEMKKLGAKPFIIPAMGSHGRGTPEGQVKILADYGITEKRMGCGILSSMETVKIGETSKGISVYIDRHAHEADHIAVVNRIKPHTRFNGKIESGLIKMCLIGLGNRMGAKTYHQAINYNSWDEIIKSAIKVVIKNSPVSFGLAIIQNANENIGKLKALKPKEFYKAEPALLNQAKKVMAKIPFNDADLLIVDEMGKNISGSGMDTNITGRKEGALMNAQILFVRDLTDSTYRNAFGIGLADYTTKRLVEKIDFKALNLNSQTAFRTDACRIPMTFDNDLEAFKSAADLPLEYNPETYKLIWIKNTLKLNHIAVSDAYINRMGKLPGVEIVKGPLEIKQDKGMNLISPFN